MKDAYVKKLDQLQQQYDKVMKKRGEDAMNDGDGWHDGSFVSATTDAHAIMEQIRFLRSIEPHISNFELPEDISTIQQGHLVQIELTDPDNCKQSLRVLIVPKGLANIVKDQIRDPNVSPISIDTPMAQALLGLERNAKSNYLIMGDKFKLRVGTTEDAISIYEPFKLLIEG